MEKREELIALSLKYDGDYFKIVEAIKKQEPIKGINIENCITIFDDDYPRGLLDLKYPPLVLFYKGNRSLINDNSIIQHQLHLGLLKIVILRRLLFQIQ